MTSTPVQPPELPNDPHDTISLAPVTEPIRVVSDLSALRVTAADHVGAQPAPSLDAVHRPAPPSEKRGVGGRAFGLVLTMGFGIAAAVGWQAWGDEARQMLSAYGPQLLASVQVAAKDATAQEPEAAPVQAAETPPPQDAAPVQQAAAATPAAATPPATPAPAAPAAAVPAELTQSIQSMTQEIAALREMVEDLKAGQQKLTRDLAKASEQEEKAREAKEAREAKRKTASQTPKQTTPLPAPNPQPITPARSDAYIPPPRPYYSRDPAYSRDVYVPPPRVATELPPERGYYAPRPPRPLP